MTTASTSEQEIIKITDLDDRYIVLIVKWLNPADLLEVGRTCKKFLKVARNQFLREHSMKVVRIQLLDDGELRVAPCATHFNHYNGILKNVTVESSNFERNKDLKLANLTDFMLKKCNKNLYKIYIVGDIELVEFGQKMERILRNVKTVEFRNRSGVVADEVQFLQYCQNLKKLILGETIDIQKVDTILQQRYQHLTHFHYLYGNCRNLSPNRLIQFTHNNDRINHIMWNLRMCDTISRYNSVECIETLRHFQHLTHLFLSLSCQLPKYTTRQFDIIRHELWQICERDAFRSLQIEVVRSRQSYGEDGTLVTRMRGFADWGKLTKIHLYRFAIAVMIPVFRLMVNLRCMALYDCLMDEPQYESTDDESSSSSGTNGYTQYALPQICEIICNNGSCDSLTRVLMLPIKYWTNLERIYAPVSSYGISLNVAELDAARRNLEDACEVTIFTDHISLPTNLQHSLVKLKCVHSIKEAQRGHQ